MVVNNAVYYFQAHFMGLFFLIIQKSSIGPFVASLFLATQTYNPFLQILLLTFTGEAELEPQSKQLEFEDVWMASQVEPLQDNFDLLGEVTS